MKNIVLAEISFILFPKKYILEQLACSKYYQISESQRVCASRGPLLRKCNKEKQCQVVADCAAGLQPANQARTQAAGQRCLFCKKNKIVEKFNPSDSWCCLKVALRLSYSFSILRLDLRGV